MQIYTFEPSALMAKNITLYYEKNLFGPVYTPALAEL